MKFHERAKRPSFTYISEVKTTKTAEEETVRGCGILLPQYLPISDPRESRPLYKVTLSLSQFAPLSICSSRNVTVTVCVTPAQNNHQNYLPGHINS